MRAVEAGAKEWHEAQMKLRAQRDAMRAHAERTDPRNLLSRYLFTYITFIYI